MVLNTDTSTRAHTHIKIYSIKIKHVYDLHTSVTCLPVEVQAKADASKNLLLSGKKYTDPMKFVQIIPNIAVINTSNMYWKTNCILVRFLTF